MSYSKPQVTIDLDEYNELKAINVENYQKAFQAMITFLSRNHGSTFLNGFREQLANEGLVIHYKNDDTIEVHTL